jgi:hypothetical protein
MNRGDQIPRWRHKCPGCKRLVFHDYIYCNPCREQYPYRKNFRLNSPRWANTSYRKGPRNGHLEGTRMTRDHLYVIIMDRLTLCIECGQKVTQDRLSHKCYYLSDGMVRTMDTIRCKSCKKTKLKHAFPLFKRKGRQLRSRLCSDCLHAKQIIAPKKRKYQRSSARAGAGAG